MINSSKLREMFPEGPKWGPIGKEVYERTYSRSKAEPGTKEDWADTVERTVLGNTGLVAKRFIEKDEADKLMKMFYQFQTLPAGRHLWVSGIPGRQFLFNCHHSGWTKQMEEHFAFSFDELMKGGGTGTNFSNRYIKILPKINSKVDVHLVCDPRHKDYEKFKHMLSTSFSHEYTGALRVGDSREGWVEPLVTIIKKSVVTGSDEPILIDVSLVRPEGEPIKGFGGTASGPGALVDLLLEFSKILNSNVGQQLNTMSLMRLEHAIAACVVAGNVRRSARMSLKSWKDGDVNEFLRCKTDDDSALWSTNISLEYDNEFIREVKKKSKHASQVYDEVIRGMLLNGEPGLQNYDLAQKGEVNEVSSTNPCGEIVLEPFENCNLGHVNLGAYYDNPNKAFEAFRLMSRFLVRATFGDITDHKQKDVVNRNRRIGVGFFGYQSFCVKQGIRYSESYMNENIRKFLAEAYKTVRKAADDYAFQLRIPAPVKCTTLAPTGTIAKMPGETEGAQTIMFRYGKRRVGYSSVDPHQKEAIEEFKKKGYFVEPSVYSKNTEVVQFLYKDKLVEEVETLGLPADLLVESAYEVELQDYLGVQSMFQELYVDNAISITVNMPQVAGTKTIEEATAFGPKYKVVIEDEKVFSGEVRAFKNTLSHYLHRIKGFTAMPAVSRRQMPYEEATKDEYLSANGLAEVSQSELECKNGVCPVK